MVRGARLRPIAVAAMMALPLLVTLARPSRCDEEAPVRFSGAGPTDTVGGILNDDTGSGQLPDVRDGAPSLTGTFLRLVGWTACVLGVGAAALHLLRKTPRLRRAFQSSGIVRVLNRTHLSSKHSVVLLRVGNQKVLLVGVSGDRMVTLCEISDPVGILAVDRDFRASMGAAAERFASDSEGDDYGQDGEVIPVTDGETDALSAAPPEIGKLRNLVQNWRKVLNHGDGEANGGAQEEAISGGRISR